MNISEENGEYDEVFCLSMSPDNKRIFSGGQDKKISIYDVNT